MSTVSTGRGKKRGKKNGASPSFWDGPAGPWSTTRSGMLAACRLTAYGLLTIGLFPAQLIGLIAWPWLAHVVPRLHHRLSATIIGLHIRCEGAPARDPSVLFVSNHVSYFDIIALGSILSASFVAKADVSAWPFFGFLAKLTRTVFVDRRTRGAHGHVETIRARLDRGDQLIVFPEGTSSDGTRVLPFKSTLFEAARAANVMVQPISISYTHLNGMPMVRALRPFYAWYGDMDLAPHLWFALSLGSPEVRIRFHKPVAAADFADRKALARYCHDEVAEGLGKPIGPGAT